MKDYWLAKLISSVEEVDSRKRLQKAIYLLQLAGCPLKCDYLLHYYGPYSFELAGLINQLDGANIIKEIPEPLPTGVVKYRSMVTEKGTKILNSFETTKNGRQLCNAIGPFIPRFQKLNEKNPWILELAATAAYYHDDNWQVAQQQTAAFKRIPENDNNLKKAIQLAKSFKKSA